MERYLVRQSVCMRYTRRAEEIEGWKEAEGHTETGRRQD